MLHNRGQIIMPYYIAYSACLLLLPSFSFCSTAWSPTMFPPILDAIIRNEIGDNEHDLQQYECKLVADYPKLYMDTRLEQERIEQVLQLDSLKASTTLTPTIFMAYMKHAKRISWCRNFLNDYVSTNSITAPFYFLKKFPDIFKDIEVVDVYTSQLIAEYNILFTAMIHADKLYKSAQFRKSILFELVEIFYGLCSQILIAQKLCLIESSYLIFIFCEYQQRFFELLPDVLRIIEMKSQRRTAGPFKTEFYLNGLKEQHLLEYRHSPLKLERVSFKTVFPFTNKLPCIIDNICTETLLRINDDTKNAKSTLIEVQSRAFQRFYSDVPHIKVAEVTISDLSRVAFSFNLPHHFYPLEETLSLTTNDFFRISNSQILIFIHSTVALMTGFVHHCENLYHLSANGDELGKRNVTFEHLENLNSLYWNSESLKTRMLVQFTISYIPCLYDYEHANLIAGFNVYIEKPILDSRIFDVNLINKMAVLNRLVLPGKDFAMIRSRFIRVYNKASHWLGVLRCAPHLRREEVLPFLN